MKIITLQQLSKYLFYNSNIGYTITVTIQILGVSDGY